MQVRVIHLSNFYNNLQRDNEEIQRLQNNLNENRSYSTTLFNSLQLEKENISALQEKILLQVVKNAPDYLSDEFSTDNLKEEKKEYQTQNSQAQNISETQLIPKDKNKDIQKTQNISETQLIPKDKNKDIQKAQNISETQLIPKDKNKDIQKAQNISEAQLIPKDKNSTKDKFSFSFRLNKS